MCLVNVISLSQVVFLDCRKDIINRFLNPVYIPLVLVEWTLSKILFVALNWFPNGGRCLAVTLQNERGGRQRCFALDSSAGTVEGGIAAFIFSGLISPHSWGGGAAALIYSFFNSSWKCSDPYKIGIEEDFKAITKWILFCFTNNIANRFKSVYIVNLMFLMFMGPIKIIFFAKKNRRCTT